MKLLLKLGANIVLLDPHRIFVEGVTVLKGNDLIAPPAIRSAMVMVIAMLAACGPSTLRNVHPILRGYEHLPERLQSVGADIQFVQS